MRALSMCFCIVVLWSQAAAAQQIHPMPLQVRVEGFVGPAPKVTSLANWVVDVDGTQYPLTVTKLQPIGADVAYWTILNALEPQPVTLTVFGDARLLRQFTSTSPGQPVAIEGSLELRRGPSSLLLRKVEPIGTPVPSATPPT